MSVRLNLKKMYSLYSVSLILAAFANIAAGAKATPLSVTAYRPPVSLRAQALYHPCPGERDFIL